MVLDIPIHLSPFLRSPRNLIGIAAGVIAIGATATYIYIRRRPTAEERERLRRDQLALTGRITDGSITDTRWPSATHFDSGSDSSSESHASLASNTPTMLLYRYQIAGVTYECAQDVSPLANLVHQVRVDLPVQVRFDPRNPGNSIVVAENWSGLRMATHPTKDYDPSPYNQYEPAQPQSAPIQSAPIESSDPAALDTTHSP